MSAIRYRLAVVVLACNIALVGVTEAQAQSTQYSGSGAYAWVDGSWQSIGLPTYDLGWRTQSPFMTGPIVVVNPVKPRVDGTGVNAAIGFKLPSGFGSNARIEFGGSVINADDSESGTFVANAANNGHGLQNVAGTNIFGNSCLAPCTFASALTTDYDSWQLNGKYATDFRAGTLTWTPSVSIFGGRADTSQDLTQRVLFTTGNSGTYNVNTELHSNDIGAKLGLDVMAPINRWVSAGLGGSIGLAHRRADLDADDSAAAFTAGNPVPFSTKTAFATASDTTTAFLASAVARLTLTPANGWSLSALAGLSFDNSVAGIQAPGTPNPVGTPGTTTPIGIKFQSETSYFAGGSLRVNF